MTKVMLDRYPMGSLPNQKTPGRYMDENLKSNIDLLVKHIVNDMQFLGLMSSSTYEVRTGKSTLMQQIGEYYTYAVNQMHGLNLTFDMKNIVFNSKDFISRAFELPKYSFLGMDENDEVDEHYFSKMSRDLRKFFKKSGQLNLFTFIIVPNFFQLKTPFAVSRSNFLIDVRFSGEFERGFFSFYSFEKKRELYVKGKKTMDYNVSHPNFIGRFTPGYAVDREEYLKVKKLDLINSETEDKRPQITEKEVLAKALIKLKQLFPERFSTPELAQGIGVHRSTANNYLNEFAKETPENELFGVSKVETYTSHLIMDDEDEPVPIPLNTTTS